MAAPASAAVFIDNFEGYTVALNQGNFQGNWMVAGGTVDLVGPGLFAELCNAGSKCVDLDGSSANAGVFTSSAFELIAGETYTATYDLAANRRVGADDVLTVEFGTASAVYTLASTSASDPFATYSLSFTPVTTGAYSLSFSTAGGDNVGPLLDNVLVSAAIPEPATWAMMIMGFGGAGTLIRRRRRLLATA
ncbi:PEPxxWA-CTERM sorting domain-containing protein [uncultured Phenylobacterium sp.]|uniref:PEPxxWA-CTERM sorting domain-containing protein n=1 Tax=uncultured Phenylobacterium sp. TaxID=349273 RepID=UPI0025CC945D|nr:PEPxxWA-CTERM sorting domain-containing protein [uncultured Phenylobacterium sp.]